MKRIPLALAVAALACAGSAQAHDVHIGNDCSWSGDYALDNHRLAMVLTREDAPAAHVVIGGGRLYVDRQPVTLSPADQQRVADYEAELRALLGDTRAVVGDALDIAITALHEVSVALAPEDEDARERLQQTRTRLRAEVERMPIGESDSDVPDAIIEPVIEEFVPQIVGSSVRMALSVAFNPEREAEMERRMERMEHTLEQRVERQADLLEQRADGLCLRVRRLDAIEAGFEFRLSDGSRLDVFEPDSH
jgi:hypothetical protein